MEGKEKNNTTPKVIVKKIIHADRERAFEAWTKPELMQHWFVGGRGTAKVVVDLRIGGKYSNEMIIESSCAESKEKQMKSYLHHGEYLEISPPERLVFTWNSPFVQNTKVTVDFRELDEGTEVTITHELPSEEACQSHQEGWTFALSGLASFLG